MRPPQTSELTETVPAGSGQRTAEQLLREVMAWHCDPESPQYNECEKDPCAWCSDAIAVIGRTPYPKLLGDVEQALDDWILTYAGEWCSRQEVKAATKRIMDGGGTLSYITSLKERIHEARRVKP